MNRTLLISAIMALPFYVLSQPFFERNDNIQVIVNNDTLQQAWAGGLNHPQVSNIDLNADGINDIFVFDKSGNKIVTYLSTGPVGQSGLELAPDYRKQFINLHSELRGLHDWVLLKDFNCDNKADIFTYSSGGLAVYRNDSQGDSLIWTLMTSLLESVDGNDTSNIYVSPIDLPAIADSDGDGDVDIITFSFSGVAAQLHRNMSMETYGNCDSLNYVVADPCWGKFEEDPSTLGVNLGISCKGEWEKPPTGVIYRSNVHSGFSLLPIDIETDGDLDIVVSNVTFDNMNLLTNGGTPLDAEIIAQDLTFPSNNTDTDPIDIYTFPAAFHVDVDNDGKRDLIGTAYQENNGENYNSVWFYKNVSTGPVQDFELQQTDFLQSEMIDLGTSAYPVFAELSGDTLLDLLVGNFGYFVSTGNYDGQLAYYKNTGTANQPEFTLMNDDYLNISTLNLNNIAPTVGDIDNDGDIDLIIGDATGIVHLFSNSAGTGNPANLSLTQPGYQGINVEGQFATPFLFDVDDDMDLDLIIGERNGNLNLYENQGSTSNAQFVLADESFGSINTNAPYVTFGYSTPFMFEMEGEKHLLVGAENGDMEILGAVEATLSAPPIIEEQIGIGTTVSSGWQETPFGFEKRSGRNQFLILAEELSSVGLLEGLIQRVSFTTQSGIETPTGSVRIKLASTSLNSLSTLLDPTDMTTVFASTGVFYNPGLQEFELSNPFIWDGESNLIVEICYAHAFSSAQNMDISLMNTGFNSNAYGGSDLTSDGCNTAFSGISQMRPEITLAIKPGFHSLGNLNTYEGERIAIHGADINNDQFMDLVVGNLSGGLSFYSGSNNGIGPNTIIEPRPKATLEVYPNPNSGNFNIKIDGLQKQNTRMHLTNLIGEKIHSLPISGDGIYSLNVPRLSKGMYILSLINNEGSVHKRVIVK